MTVQVKPFVVKRADFLRLMGSPLIGRQVLYAADHGVAPWCDLLKTIREGGRGSERLLDYESACACYEKIRAVAKCRLFFHARRRARARTGAGARF